MAGQLITQKYLNDQVTQVIGNLIAAFRAIRNLHDYTGGLNTAAVLALPDPDGLALTSGDEGEAARLLSTMTIANNTFLTALGGAPVGNENQLIGFASQFAKIV